MAGIDTRNALPALSPRPQAPERVEALRQAQRAFFQAALAGKAAPSASSGDPSPPPPTGTKPDGAPLRPGSLVDLKV